MVLQKGKIMIQENTLHFLINYNMEDTDFARKLKCRLEPFYTEICEKAFLCPGEDVYSIYICGTVDEFITLAGKTKETYQDWMVGNTDIFQKRLCILSPRAKGGLSEAYVDYLTRVMLHETVHIVFDRVCVPEKCEIWLAEGIALLYAGQINVTHVSETEYPRIAQISGMGAENDFADNGGYTYAGIYVWYLIRLHGMETFLAAYKGECEVGTLLGHDFEIRAITAYKEAVGRNGRQSALV